MANNVAHRPSHSSSRPSHQRGRSASDPFVDPVAVYTAPHLPHNTHPRSAPVSAVPQVPPKQLKKSRQHIDSRDPRMLESAVRDAVTVRPVDQAPRTRIGRSQTGFAFFSFLFLLFLFSPYPAISLAADSSPCFAEVSSRCLLHPAPRPPPPCLGARTLRTQSPKPPMRWRKFAKPGGPTRKGPAMLMLLMD